MAGCSADPRAVLDATAKAYRQAKTYADDARVRVVTTRGDEQVDGLLSLWIDRRSHVLRRLSLPTNAYAALLSQQAGAATGVSVVVDFVNAALDETIPPDAFAFAAPPFTLARLPEQVIVPRRQPVRFKVASAWRAGGVAMPGNLVCVAEPGADAEPAAAQRIVCLDGWRSVVVLDAEGREVGRHELALPAGAAISFLRTVVDSEGRRWWLGGARGGQQVFLFDDHWKLRSAYPPAGGPTHAGIADSLLHDCTGDGAPEILVGCLGSVGVHCIDLDGRRLWRERSLTGAVSVAARAANDASQGLACVDGIGRFVPLGCDGTAGEPVRLADPEAPATPLVLRSVVGGPVAMDGAWALIGMAAESLGKNTAVGLTADGAVAWTLPLADGIHREGAIDAVAWADLLGSSRSQWLIAAPDGSVTVAWADGGVVDRYCHGRPLLGIGGYRTPQGGHIVLATPEGVESLRMEDIALD